MRVSDRPPLWPYVLVVTCLFIAAVLAAQAWRSDGRGKVASDAGRRDRNGAISERHNDTGRASPPNAMERAARQTATQGVSLTLDARRAATAPELDERYPHAAAQSSFPAASPQTDTALLEIPIYTVAAAPDGEFADETAPAAPWIDLLLEEPIEEPLPAAAAPPIPNTGAQLRLIDRSTGVRGSEERLSDLEIPSGERRGTAVHPWPRAESLEASLAQLAERTPHNSEVHRWATHSLQLLGQLHDCNSLAGDEAGAVVRELSRRAEEGQTLANQARTEHEQAAVLANRYALARRASVWQHVHFLAKQAAENSLPTAAAAAPYHPRTMYGALRGVQGELGHGGGADAWRQYLLLAEVDRLAGVESAAAEAERRAIARRLLERMHTTQLSADQRAYLERPAFEEFRNQLRRWADEPLDWAELLAAMERYEQTLGAADARRLAELQRVLFWSHHADRNELGNRLDSHYRNANFRVAVNEQLVNRFVPEMKPQSDDVHDEILGARVFGRSHTSTRLLVRLLPDGQRLRWDLEARGTVEAETAATKGAATFHSDSESRFRASKLFSVDRQGNLQVSRAQAQASSISGLRGVQTTFEGVPLIGIFARNYAVNQHDQQAPLARRETEGRVAHTVERRLDAEVQRQLAKAQTDLREKVVEPLNRLGLEPVAIDMATTNERLIMRCRLAGPHQLGAHTARPQAPSDSWLSFQVHETSLNNSLEQFGLEGRRLALHDLYREVAGRVGANAQEIPEDLPEDVTIEFADHHAVRVRCDGERLMLDIHLKELEAGSRSWRNFTVRAYYAPDAASQEAELARDGAIELIGEGLGFRDQVALRGIFTKVLSRNRTLKLLDERFRQDERLHDLQVIQFTLRDGWIGLALGPRRVAARGK